MLQRIDFGAGTNTTVGRFPEGQNCVNEAAAYDPVVGIYYADLEKGVAAMDVSSGIVLWHSQPFANQAMHTALGLAFILAPPFIVQQ